MALHVSRDARSRLRLEDGSGFEAGKLLLDDLGAARELARRLRDAEGGEGEAAATATASAGELYALSRLETVFQLVISRHLRERDPGALEGFLRRGQEALGVDETARLLDLFAGDFSLPGGRDALLREFLVWWAIDENPAATAATERLYAGPFRADPGLATLRDALERPAGAPDAAGGDELLARLREPFRAAPGSLSAQLRWVLENWDDLLGVDRRALLRGLDLLAEEEKRFVFAAPGPGPVEVPSFADLDAEPENYSPDLDWMPGVVLLAKNVYVWLDQLSKSYERPIRRLDEIPDEALEEIAGWGFTALWLIGVWERSAASQRLKRLCGNPEAVASAYSLRSYRVAADLGGDEALAGLQERALTRGIRLGSDMVPNHFGLDSDWLLRHPERFLSVPECPFAAYTFDGPDLSPDPAVGIWVEDHYFDRSDAAVVFKREDRATGEVRYVYHGNDGTSMPWNDTAQLDYLNPETREAVIATILEVARRFPLIRFDAAMTLARRHYQRLWFPAPGTGGAIPSRAEHGLDRQAFAERMPEEFWRQVVDRVAREAPDTLLLAEAFWLMEGYFVRSLGMHRVYNSAFMNMLRDQENAKYRRLIKETLSFDARILQRYVNFLTNPDERTAIDQFGREDRYFGACVLLATLPGLPMFGHGQIEGLGEKYGMEYRRAYHEETADTALVERHEREIVPLLRRRASFAGVDRFELYDFVDADGAVNDNVIAFSNGGGGETIVVLFNNAFAGASGTLVRSVPRDGRGERAFAEAAGFHGEAGGFWIFRDQPSGRTYLRPASELAGSGLAVHLPAFGYRVFREFRWVAEDADGRYGRLARGLGREGVDDVERALADLDLEPAAAALGELFARPLVALQPGDDGEAVRRDVVAAAVEVLRRLHGGDSAADAEERLERRLDRRLAAVEKLSRLEREVALPATERMRGLGAAFDAWLAGGPETRVAAAALQILAALEGTASSAAERLRRLPVERALGQSLAAAGAAPERVARTLQVVQLGWRRGWGDGGELPGAAELRALLRRWTGDEDVRPLIGFHRSDEGEWIGREDFEELVSWRLAAALTAVFAAGNDRGERAVAASGWLEVGDRLRGLARRAAYRADRLDAAAPRASSLPPDGEASPPVRTASE